ncbi:MAG: hypothetical protein U0414_27195 [Polyangiaceae bacterium]
MKTTALSLLSIVGLLAGCAGSASKLTAKAPVTHAEVSATDEKTDTFTELDQDLTADAAGDSVVDPRKTGDFVVFSFEGSYRTAPLELTERVVDRSDKAITVELAFKEKGKPTETLQVTTSLELAHAGEVLGVKQIDAKGKATPVERAKYDTLMAMTVASTDVNDAELLSVPAKVNVSGKDLAVTATTYRVKIGAAQATLQTLSSDDFAWGDVGGEIRIDQGGVFYKATLVQMGADPSSVASVDTATKAN